MNFLDLFKNYHLVCSLAAFFIAQAIKVILTLIIHRRFDVRKFIENGGMPSSHTSTVCALTVSILNTEGAMSPITAVSLILTIIVMIDAMGVRRATGDNSKLLNKIVHDLFEEKNSQYLLEDIKQYVGHKPLEVLVGAFIGILIPFIIKPL